MPVKLARRWLFKLLYALLRAGKFLYMGVGLLGQQNGAEHEAVLIA
jgi:hypothetical protein